MNQGLGGRVPFSRGQVLAAPKKNSVKTKFPECFSKKVNMKKIKLDAFRPWISFRLNELLGSEDEVIEAYVNEMIDAQSIDPKDMQVALKGFMGAAPSATFMKELYELLLEAQTCGGVPEQLKSGFEKGPTLSTDEMLRKRVEEINKNILGGGALGEPLSHAKGAWGSGEGSGQRQDEDRGRQQDPRDRPRDDRDFDRDRDRDRDSHQSRDRDYRDPRDHRDDRDRGRRDRSRSRDRY